MLVRVIPVRSRRLPDLEICGKAEMLQSNFIHGIKRMQCTFTPGGAR